jgi:hypothetical protein
MLLAVLLLAQAAPAAVPERFSILQPVGNAPCPGPEQRNGDDVVVCATDLPDQTVPLPQDYVYSTPRPSNPDMTGAGALAASATPCAAQQAGCQVGFGPPLMPIVAGLVGLVRDATRKKPDRTGRVDIPLDPTVPLPLPPATPAP